MLQFNKTRHDGWYPVYSDDATIHDYVVQATGAFDETITGILNLKELKTTSRDSSVLHRQTVDRLPQLAEFISRNLLFVDQVALMGLEITGFTRANLEQLWIDPKDYSTQLKKAASIFEAYRIPFLITTISCAPSIKASGNTVTNRLAIGRMNTSRFAIRVQ